ncbi:hypothetical protein AB2L57_15370 [Microbacterium sp. HA-8]|uniref:hypothetical protein n=1 Tax=Microbacterium sp. HA-8 TaxID=3234200 RepID=UPI0038F7DA12
MDESTVSELRALRARAYGPEADIADDPARLRRLEELEAIARASRYSAGRDEPAAEPDPAVPVVAGTSADAGGPRHRAPEPGWEAEAGPEPTPSAVQSDATPTRGEQRRSRLVIAWVASLVIAVLITAIVTGVVSRRVQADPREVGVLGIDTFAELPEIFAGWQCGGPDCDPEDVAGEAFAGFFGLAIYRMPGGWTGGRVGDECLLIMDAASIEPESNSFSGPIYSGCAAGGFAATVQLSVTSELPDELRDEFAEGTGLRFIEDGDEVVVLSDAE